MRNNLKKIFIAYAEAGAGHWKAAEAIYAEMKKNDSSSDIRLINSFEKSGSFMVWAYNWSYIFMVSKIPWLWGASYYSLDNRFLYSFIARYIRRLFNAIVSQKLTKFIIDENPEVIVCTHFHMLEVACHLKRKGKITSHIVCVVTDYMAHNFWIEKEVDLYIAGHEDTKTDLVRRGIDSRSIRVIGIPVENKFLYSRRSEDIKNELGLKDNLLTALIVSGGFGVGPIEKIVLSLKDKPLPIQLIVVCGKNDLLLNRIKNHDLPSEVFVKPFGFVDNMHDLMDVSDVIVSKSGGLITSEAIVKKIPMIIFSPIPGQEEKNCRMIVKNQLGVRLNAITEFPNLMSQCATKESFLKRFKENISHASDPKVTEHIVKAICDYDTSQR